MGGMAVRGWRGEGRWGGRGLGGGLSSGKSRG